MFERPDFPAFIDSTTRKSWVACPMQAYYNHFLHLRPKGSNIHLHFGGVLAKAFEEFRKAFYGRAEGFDNSYKCGMNEILKGWGDIITPERSQKTFANCILCFDDYFREYPPADDPVKPLMIKGEPAIEFSFALPIPGLMHPQTGDPLVYSGRFDMLAEFNGGIFIEDEKTAAALGPSWPKSYHLASQMTGYTWAAQQFGHKVAGVIIRGISPQTYQVKHLQLIEHRPKWQVDRWLAQLVRDVKRMISSWEEGVFDYNLDGSCASYSGCAYMTLCSARQPEKYMHEYHKVIWDPLAGTETQID